MTALNGEGERDTGTTQLIFKGMGGVDACITEGGGVTLHAWPISATPEAGGLTTILGGVPVSQMGLSWPAETGILCPLPAETATGLSGVTPQACTIAGASELIVPAIREPIDSVGTGHDALQLLLLGLAAHWAAKSSAFLESVSSTPPLATCCSSSRSPGPQII